MFAILLKPKCGAPAAETDANNKHADPQLHAYNKLDLLKLIFECLVVVACLVGEAVLSNCVGYHDAVVYHNRIENFILFAIAWPGPHAPKSISDTFKKA